MPIFYLFFLLKIKNKSNNSEVFEKYFRAEQNQNNASGDFCGFGIARPEKVSDCDTAETEEESGDTDDEN